METKTLLQPHSNPRILSSSLGGLSKVFLYGLIFGITTLDFRLAYSADSIRGPDVEIIAGEDKTILEFRQNGHLRMIQIIPKRGKPYYLVPVDPTQNGGDLMRSEKLVPSWIITSFD